MIADFFFLFAFESEMLIIINVSSYTIFHEKQIPLTVDQFFIIRIRILKTYVMDVNYIGNVLKVAS